jgi:WD repeat-containing protein 35
MSISVISRVKFKFLFNFRNTHAALKTALRLVQYEKELDAKEVYRLISLSAFLNRSYKECSKAISKLENLPNLTKEEREKYQELAISIFTKYDPQNVRESQIKCPGKNCDLMISE